MWIQHRFWIAAFCFFSSFSFALRTAKDPLCIGSVSRESRTLAQRWIFLRDQLPLDYQQSDEFFGRDADRLYRLEADKLITDYQSFLDHGKTNQREGDTAGLYDAPLLDRETEMHIFRRYNYLLFYANDQLTRYTEPVRSRVVQVESALDQAATMRNLILAANTRLVRGLTTGEGEFGDGIDSLVNAVRGFDYTRGNKFSTYATWAIRRNLIRYRAKHGKISDREKNGLTDQLNTVTRSYHDPSEALDHEELLGQLRTAMESLDDRERHILRMRMGFDGDPMTLEEVGEIVGVTKERVRQIEKRARERLRTLLAQ